jgi:phage tail protein X
LLVEGVYHINDREYLPAVGIETLVGPLALRAGYHAGSDLTEFTFGTGFLWGVSSLDYAFGLAQELNSSHRISLSTRFGGSQAQTAIVQKKPEANSPLITFQQRPVYEIKRAEGENPPARIYFVRPGDTLKSIAKAVYGREQMWDEIYRANQHLLNDPENLTPGQKILLPAQTR